MQHIQVVLANLAMSKQSNAFFLRIVWCASYIASLMKLMNICIVYVAAFHKKDMHGKFVISTNFYEQINEKDTKQKRCCKCQWSSQLIAQMAYICR